MPVKFGAFNVFGIGGRNVAASIAEAAKALLPDDPSLSAISFEEVWHRDQLTHIVNTWVGANAAITTRTNVDIYRAPNGAWRCLVPLVPPVKPLVGPELPLSSGLALCVRGPVKDSFFSPYRGGEVPDRFANKGVLAALVETPGQPRRAIVGTHLHDYSNDAWGRARNNNLDVLASALGWIRDNWRVPAIVLGDFNIDSRAAYHKTDETHRRLYLRLVRLTLSGNAAWWDANARFTSFNPMATHDGGGAIDHHLGVEPQGVVPLFQALTRGTTGSTSNKNDGPGGSDHFLTISQWP